MSPDGTEVLLKKLDIQSIPFITDAQHLEVGADDRRLGVTLDCETTGFSADSDQILEIGIRQFEFDRTTGKILSLKRFYSGFQDPGSPISEEIQQLTGITDAMVKGKAIDWTQVDSILEESHLIIAHNAPFDRPFVDKKSSISPKKVWGCSVKQIPWNEKGFTSSKLELLCIWNGFFTDSHRALADADALLFLLSLNDPESHQPHLRSLLDRARKPSSKIVASGSPFESKDRLKSRRYQWDAAQRAWIKTIDRDQVNSEIEWLETEVYHGAFRGSKTDIDPVDQFKSR